MILPTSLLSLSSIVFVSCNRRSTMIISAPSSGVKVQMLVLPAAGTTGFAVREDNKFHAIIGAIEMSIMPTPFLKWQHIHLFSFFYPSGLLMPPRWVSYTVLALEMRCRNKTPWIFVACFELFHGKWYVDVEMEQWAVINTNDSARRWDVQGIMV